MKQLISRNYCFQRPHCQRSYLICSPHEKLERRLEHIRYWLLQSISGLVQPRYYRPRGYDICREPGLGLRLFSAKCFHYNFLLIYTVGHHKFIMTTPGSGSFSLRGQNKPFGPKISYDQILYHCDVRNRHHILQKVSLDSMEGYHIRFTGFPPKNSTIRVIASPKWWKIALRLTRSYQKLIFTSPSKLKTWTLFQTENVPWP